METKSRISDADVLLLREAFKPLLHQQFRFLSLPIASLVGFEPSQIGTICGSLMDACLPYLGLEDIPELGLAKHQGILGEREGYPDYQHSLGFRVELKLLYMDNRDLRMKRPPTAREPSARLTQKVTLKNVQPDKDVMLILAYQLRPQEEDPAFVSPTIIDYEVFSMIDLVEARDKRLLDCGGRWFGNYETPTIVSKIGRKKLKNGLGLDTSVYGRKESEGKDFNEDTNFGKLKRIPHRALQAFLAKCRRAAAGSDQEV
jgi:hypothetical protein